MKGDIMLKRQKKGVAFKHFFPNLALATGCIAAGAAISSAHYRKAARKGQTAGADIEKRRTNLLRALSHDLRTPLSSIMGNCLVFLENYDILKEEEKHEIITNIYKESEWLINMVENLLIITRIKNDNISIHVNEELVEEVISEALQKIEKRYPDSKINVIIPADFILLPMDAILIEQTVINLVENAILHSDSTKPLDIIIKDGPKDVSFTVRDYGHGILTDTPDDLFDGASCYSADVHKGMGIGLTICKTIIEAHHGTIKGKNHGNGAEFIFTLPKAKAMPK